MQRNLRKPAIFYNFRTGLHSLLPHETQYRESICLSAGSSWFPSYNCSSQGVLVLACFKAAQQKESLALHSSPWPGPEGGTLGSVPGTGHFVQPCPQHSTSHAAAGTTKTIGGGFAGPPRAIGPKILSASRGTLALRPPSLPLIQLYNRKVLYCLQNCLLGKPELGRENNEQTRNSTKSSAGVARAGECIPHIPKIVGLKPAFWKWE